MLDLSEEMCGLYSVEAPHFCCGLTVERGFVTTTAPIVKYMVGWTLTKVKAYCSAKKWKISYLGV